MPGAEYAGYVDKTCFAFKIVCSNPCHKHEKFVPVLQVPRPNESHLASFPIPPMALDGLVRLHKKGTPWHCNSFDFVRREHPINLQWTLKGNQ